MSRTSIPTAADYLPLDLSVSHYYISWFTLDRVKTFLRYFRLASDRYEVLGWYPTDFAMPAYYCIQDLDAKEFAPQPGFYGLDP